MTWQMWLAVVGLAVVPLIIVGILLAIMADGVLPSKTFGDPSEVFDEDED